MGTITIPGFSKKKQATQPEITLEEGQLTYEECHTSLVLLMDSSSSLKPSGVIFKDINYWNTQLYGTADAVESDEVIDIINSTGPIALSAAHFSKTHTPMIPWKIIRNAEDAEAFAAELRGFADVELKNYTHMGAGIAGAVKTLDESPCVESRDVIDISTDGGNSFDGGPLAEARRQAMEKGRNYIINGISVSNGSYHDFIKDHVVTPDGKAFNATWESYADIIKQKFITDISLNDASPDEPLTPNAPLGHKPDTTAKRAIPG